VHKCHPVVAAGRSQIGALGPDRGGAAGTAAAAERPEEHHMTKREMSEAILQAKRASGSSWAKLAETTGVGEVYLASCAHGENTLTPESAAKVGSALALSPELQKALLEPPMKGWSMEKPIPTDPLIYRFYEIIAVYGTTLKDVITDKFGEGIMSAIDFRMDVDKQEHPKGTRVVVTMNGKFLPYARW
jgi:cyanate lyase